VHFISATSYRYTLSNTRTLVDETGLGANYLDVHPTAKTLYWTESLLNIHSYDWSATSPDSNGTLITTLTQALSVAVDPQSSDLYVNSPYVLLRLDYEEDEIIDISINANLYIRIQFYITYSNGYIYFGFKNTSSNVYGVARCSNDGTNLQILYTSPIQIDGRIAVDYLNNKLYLCSHNYAQLYRSNLDGTQLELVSNITDLFAIFLLPEKNLMFLSTDGGTDKAKAGIYAARLDFSSFRRIYRDGDPDSTFGGVAAFMDGNDIIVAWQLTRNTDDQRVMMSATVNVIAAASYIAFSMLLMILCSIVIVLSNYII